VRVAGVIPGSPADRAGLRAGDEIRFVGDRRISTIQSLTDTIGGSEPGTQVDLLIRRNGRRQIVEARLAAHETTFGSGDPSKNNEALEKSGPTIGVSLSPSRGRGADGFASGHAGVSVRDSQIRQRMTALEGEISRLQQQLNHVRYAPRAHGAAAFDPDAWWQRQHHGAGGNDPALFQ
jgi:hypothetical protein